MFVVGDMEVMEMSERRIQNNRLRRQKERRKNILLFIMAVCSVCSLSFSAGSFLSSAKDYNKQTGQAEYKYYASIPVEEGDTLWSIAETHMGSHYRSVEDYIKEIRKINALDGDNIQSGGYIVVPYYSAECIR